MLRSNSWVLSWGLIDEGLWSQYLHALYWSITTLTTVGYGDISPTNDTEVFYAIWASYDFLCCISRRGRGYAFVPFVLCRVSFKLCVTVRQAMH